MYQVVNNVAVKELSYHFTTRDKRSTTKRTITNNSKKDPQATTIKRILVVEDDPIIQTVVRLFLKHLGHHFDIAGNGQEALALYNTNSYDLIFMDVELPDTNGIAITEKIRASEGSEKRIPIVAMTSRTDTECKDQCLRMGMNAFSNKPTSIDEVQAIIGRHIK